MNRNSLILTGNPFKAVLQTIGVFLLLLTISVYLLIDSVENALYQELQQQILEETQLLSDIYASEGMAGLKQAVQQVRSTERLADVYRDGISLTGWPAIVPSIKAVNIQRGEIIRHSNGQYYTVQRKHFDAFELLVGRSTRLVTTAKQRLLIGASIMGLAFVALALVIGYYFSHHSSKKLMSFEHTLAKIANGDLSARLPVVEPREQIDSIAQKMNTQLSRLERLVESMNNTTKAIAHDLKTPLSRVQIALNESLDAMETGDNPEPFVQRALNENVRINNIFDTMLRISRLQTQPRERAHDTFNANSMLAEVVEFLSPNAGENGQHVAIDCEEKLTISGDRQMLQQAIMNLLNNAILYAGEGATITVSAADKRLQVSDNGVGVPDEELGNLTTAFTRLDSARNSEGNGLGLALVQAIADYHGATLKFSANTPSGLCVIVALGE